MSLPEQLNASDFVIPEQPSTPSTDAGERYISIRNWERFQHKDVWRKSGGRPPWIKAYTALLHDDDWAELSQSQQGILVNLWLMYASAGRSVSETVARRKLCRSEAEARYWRGHVEALNSAGFIEVSSQPSSAPVAPRVEKRRGTTLSTQVQPEAVEISSRSSKDVAREDRSPNEPPPDTEWWHAQQTERERERRERSGYVDNLSSYTGVRIVRGEVGISYVYDPLGTEPPPNGWPHSRPTKGEVLVALRGKG